MESQRNCESLDWCSRQLSLNSNFARSHLCPEGRQHWVICRGTGWFESVLFISLAWGKQVGSLAMSAACQAPGAAVLGALPSLPNSLALVYKLNLFPIAILMGRTTWHALWNIANCSSRKFYFFWVFRLHSDALRLENNKNTHRIVLWYHGIKRLQQIKAGVLGIPRF